ncbi:MAG: hypothetical protein PHU97_02845 [Bacteroidales bacterium]|jgi:hypothetical protein|nr:hypothetical protein [Bacteroidales bacterium]
MNFSNRFIFNKKKKEIPEEQREKSDLSGGYNNFAESNNKALIATLQSSNQMVFGNDKEAV